MTIQEFSNTFDVLANSFGDGGTSALTFDEYEKSVFLTRAQEQIVVELYTGRNIKGEPFEGSEELRANLRELIRTEELSPSTTVHKGISEYSKFFVLPSDLLFITYEAVRLKEVKEECVPDDVILVVPVTQDEFYKVMQNPFKQANNRRALRLDNSANLAELVSKHNIDKYIIRYLSKPSPIVLGDFTEVTDDEEMMKSKGCDLNPAIHRDILERAVTLAIASRSIHK